MGDRKSLIRWIKDHKKQLIIAGVSIGALILIVLGTKNRAEIEAVWDSLKGVLKQLKAKTTKEVVEGVGELPPTSTSVNIDRVTSETKADPYEVSSHIRNLPVGCHASREKIDEARKKDIHLLEGQTWVVSYTKRADAA